MHKTHTYKKIFIYSFIIGLLIPFIIQAQHTHAQIAITEIMYDPEGTDTKREWIEVFNSSQQDIDLTTWFFYENNVFHRITAHTSSILAPGQYAIIADSIAEVLAQYTNIPLIFDSAFSLNNTGESFAMATPDKQILETITYSSDMGASGDGNSLQINEGVIISATPTPGQSNATQSTTPPSDSNSQDNTSSSGSTSNSNSGSTSNNQSSHAQQVGLSSYKPPVPFKLGIGRNRKVPIRTPIEFNAEVSDSDAKIAYIWNFGDMNVSRKKNTNHIYQFPGIYNVVLHAYIGSQSAVSRVQIEVFEPQLEVMQDIESISIKNTSKEEINIGEFDLVYLGEIKKIPENTIISAGQTLTIVRRPHEVLEALLYSDEKIYTKVNSSSIALNVYMWCIQNTHQAVCNEGYIAKLFDIIQRWLS